MGSADVKECGRHAGGGVHTLGRCGERRPPCSVCGSVNTAFSGGCVYQREVRADVQWFGVTTGAGMPSFGRKTVCGNSCGRTGGGKWESGGLAAVQAGSSNFSSRAPCDQIERRKCTQWVPKPRHTAARSGEKTGGGELPISRLILGYIKAERGRGTLDTSGRGDGPGSERCECVGFGTAVKKRIGCVE